MDLQLEQLRNLGDSSENLTEMKFQRVLCSGCFLALAADAKVLFIYYVIQVGGLVVSQMLTLCNKGGVGG